MKKQLKGTKEQSRLTLHPTVDSGQIVSVKRYSFDEYIKDNGFLTFSKTKKVLDPYIRIKLSSAKFDLKKYNEDKESLVTYYNSLGYRDAVIEKDTVYHNANGDLNIDIKMNEGRKYYYGNISWRVNTK